LHSEDRHTKNPALSIPIPKSATMSKIVRERYENGVLVERTIEGSNTTPWHWLTLVVHTVIAITLVALTAAAVHDSLTFRATLSEEDASQTSCEQSGFRS
jgi:hypothetical protein